MSTVVRVYFDAAALSFLVGRRWGADEVIL